MGFPTQSWSMAFRDNTVIWQMQCHSLQNIPGVNQFSQGFWSFVFVGYIGTCLHCFDQIHPYYSCKLMVPTLIDRLCWSVKYRQIQTSTKPFWNSFFPHIIDRFTVSFSGKTWTDKRLISVNACCLHGHFMARSIRSKCLGGAAAVVDMTGKEFECLASSSGCCLSRCPQTYLYLSGTAYDKIYSATVDTFIEALPRD